MKCPKCSGFMFMERYYDYFLRFDAWKCINCGCIMDDTIRVNKANENGASVATLQPAVVKAK